MELKVTCFKLPMTTILMENNDIDFEKRKDLFVHGERLRNLISQKLETYDYVYHVLRTKICIGIPEQCFNVVYDTGNIYLILGLDTPNAQFVKKYKPSESQTQKSDSNNLLALPYRYGIIQAREIEDYVQIPEQIPPRYMLSFLGSWNTTEKYNFDGILGLGNYYPKEEEEGENSFDERFSYVHNLYSNGIIEKKIFGHQYNNRTHGNLYFGEVPPSMGFNFFKCKVAPFIPYSNKWHCESRSISLSSGQNFTQFKSPMVFDTGYIDIRGPYYEGNTILDNLVSASGGKCKMDFNDIDDTTRICKIICDIDLDIKSIPDIGFNLKGFELKLKNIDMFRLVQIDHRRKYLCKIIGDSRYNYWVLGEPVLKNYDMVFDYEENSVGFFPNINLYEGDWTNVIILSLLFISVVCFAIYLFSNRKKLFAKMRNRDIEKLNRGNAFDDGAQMTEVLES